MVTPLLPGTLVAGALDLDVGVLLPAAGKAVVVFLRDPLFPIIRPIIRRVRDISIPIISIHEEVWDYGLLAGVATYPPVPSAVPKERFLVVSLLLFSQEGAR